MIGFNFFSSKLYSSLAAYLHLTTYAEFYLTKIQNEVVTLCDNQSHMVCIKDLMKHLELHHTYTK